MQTHYLRALVGALQLQANTFVTTLLPSTSGFGFGSWLNFHVASREFDPGGLR